MVMAVKIKAKAAAKPKAKAVEPRPAPEQVIEPPAASGFAADDKLTKLTGNVIAAVSAQVRHLVDVGLVEPEKLRLTIEARREKAKQLVAGGLSQRQAAAELGVSKSALNRDLSHNGTQSVPERDTTDREERREEAAISNAATAAVVVLDPVRTYETIVLDPPWPMQKIERDVRPNQVAFDYPTMSEIELAAFGDKLGRMAADDCHLFMWTTQKHLPTALELIDGYGFRYVLVMVWHKAGGFQPVGLPQYNCEFVVYARKGTPKFTTTQGFFCCFNGPRREHSRKPDEFYDMIRLVTAGPRIDVFSREEREGFEQYGNEPAKFTVAAQ
jgi:N6-adenosine-specific RNA methylase IME4